MYVEHQARRCLEAALIHTTGAAAAERLRLEQVGDVSSCVPEVGSRLRAKAARFFLSSSRTLHPSVICFVALLLANTPSFSSASSLLFLTDIPSFLFSFPSSLVYIFTQRSFSRGRTTVRILWLWHSDDVSSTFDERVTTHRGRMATASTTPRLHKMWFADIFTDERVTSLSQKVSTLRDKVFELERQNALLSYEKGILEKELEETAKRTQEFSSQKEEVERSLQEYKNAAEVSQAQLEEQIKAKVDELKVLGTQKEEVDAGAASLESDIEARKRECELLKWGNDELRSKVLMVEEKYSVSEEEVKRLKTELDALTEAKEAAAKAFDAEKEEIIKELEDLKKKLEEIKANKDLVESENDKLRSEVLSAEQKYSMSEDDVKRLKMQLSALEEAKEATVRAFDVEKAEIMKESDDLKRKLEEIQVKKDLLETENDKLRSEVLLAEQKKCLHEEEIKRIKMELDTLVEMKEAAAITFDADKTRIMKELEDHKRRVEELQTNFDLTKGENDKLQLELSTIEQKYSLSEAEAKRLQIELSALAEAKEAIVKAFDAEKAEMTKELENLNKILEETQTHKDLLKGENERLQSDVLTIERNYIQSEAEVKRLQMEFSVLADVKEANAKGFDAEKAKIMKELENLRSEVGEIQASKEAAEEIGRDKDAQAEKLRADLEDLHISMSQLKASYDELEAKHSHLNHEKDSVQKELDAEKAEAMKLKSKIEVLESYNNEKDSEIEKLNISLEEKNGKIDVLNKDIEVLRLVMAEAQRKKKGDLWANLSSAKTRLSSCITK